MDLENLRENLLQTALDCGAAKAVSISQSQIVLSAEFRRICETNQCGGYGGCWMCPPFIGEIGELMERVRSYPGAVLYQTIHEIEDSFDLEGMFAAGGKHALVSADIEKKLRRLQPADYLHLSCGGCHLCETCARKTAEPCRFPDRALPSLEGYGVDVYNTAKDTPLQYINGPNTVTYFGMILYSFS